MKATDFCGCRRNPNRKTPVQESLLGRQVQHYQGWSNYVLPPTSQYKLGLCVCVASCCALEMKIRRDMGAEYLPYPMQLDPRPLFKHARAKHWPDEPWDEGGLLLDQGYDAMMDLRWIPKDTEIARISTMHFAGMWMEDFPGIMGLGITDGWMQDRVSQRTGQIDESMSPAQSLAGHALTMVSFIEMVQQQFLLFANSGWKETWGNNGYGVATLPYIKEALLDDCLFLKFNSDWRSHIMNALKNIPMLTDDWGSDNQRL